MYNKVVTLDSNWKKERAQELMKQYLDKGGHADGVFGHSDLGAIGAFLEAERRGIYKQMLIVGIDGLPGEWEGVDRVKRGQFAASYVYPTQGEKIIDRDNGLDRRICLRPCSYPRWYQQSPA